MALTVSNRETFAVLDWLDGDPERREYWRARARKLSNLDTATAVPNLSNMIYEELSKEIPESGRGLGRTAQERAVSRQFLRIGSGAITRVRCR